MNTNINIVIIDLFYIVVEMLNINLNEPSQLYLYHLLHFSHKIINFEIKRIVFESTNDVSSNFTCKILF